MSGKTAEEAMLLAAMEGDDDRLNELAADTHLAERVYLNDAMNKVRNALDRAGA